MKLKLLITFLMSIAFNLKSVTVINSTNESLNNLKLVWYYSGSEFVSCPEVSNLLKEECLIKELKSGQSFYFKVGFTKIWPATIWIFFNNQVREAPIDDKIIQELKKIYSKPADLILRLTRNENNILEIYFV